MYYFFNWWTSVYFRLVFWICFPSPKTWRLHWVTCFNPKFSLLHHFDPSPRDASWHFWRVRECPCHDQKSNMNICGFDQCFAAHFNDHSVSPSVGLVKRWKKWIHICKVRQRNDMQSYNPDLFEPGQCTYVAKGWCKGDCKTFAGGSGERERRAEQSSRCLCKCKQSERTLD